MSLVLADIDSYPEIQDGEASLGLRLTLAVPEKAGDPQGWRASAVCLETGRVIGRWMSTCPLSAAQSALLWVGMFDWSVSPDMSADGAWNYEQVLNESERPLSHEGVHVRDLLDIVATNLPPRKSKPASAQARKVPAVIEQEVTGDEDGDDEEGDEEDAEAARVEHRRLLAKALRLVRSGRRDVASLVQDLTRRGGADLAATFVAAEQATRVASAPVVVAPVVAAPGLSPEAEKELERFGIGDETGVRAKLERTTQRAAREHARVEKILAERAAREAAARAAAAVTDVLAAAVPVPERAPRKRAQKKDDVTPSSAPPSAVEASVVVEKPKRTRRKPALDVAAG